MANKKRTALAAVLAVFAVLVITVTVLSLVKVNDGFNDKDVKPAQIQVIKEGTYIYGVENSPKTHALLNSNGSGEQYEKFISEYYKMTSYSIMRGIIEGKFSPKATLEETLTEWKDITALKAEEGQYLITLIFNESVGAQQEAEIKVKKGTKANPNSVKVGETTYNEKDKVSIKYNSLVLIIEENNFVNELKLYAFDRAKKDDPDFEAYQISVKANRIGLYNLCKELLP